MLLETGRPAICDGRLPREIRTYDFLDKLGVEYLRADHEAAMTMEACQAVDIALGTAMCKNLFLCNRQETDFYLLLIPGDKKFRTKDVSSQIGSSRLSFANESYMLEFLDILPGSVSVLGLMNDENHRVSLLIDKDLMADTYIGCHPCVNTSSLRIAQRDLFDKILPATGHTFRIVDLPRQE